MLQFIIKFSVRNKLLIGIMTFVWIVWGLWSATKLPIDAVPDITNNQVQIFTHCPTLATQEVEQLVTFPVEQSLTNIPDIEEIRSISRFGLSVITVVFKENVDIYFGRQLINESLKEAIDNIPEGIGVPELSPVSTGLGEVYQYLIKPKLGSEDKYDAKDLRTMQDWIVARQLNGTPGVAEINSFGGELKQYEVAIDPDKLRAMGISIPEVFEALEQNNQNTGGAYIDKKPNAYFIRGVGMVTSLEDIGNIAIKSRDHIPIFVKDVAEVQYGHAIRYGALTYDGISEGVGGVVMMLKGENSNEVVKRVKEKLPNIQKSLPDDIVIEPFLDRADLVGRAIRTVEKNLLEGALIVIFVLVLFLGNFRAGFIVASAIPLSLLFALGVMRVFGVSANLMSLGAIDFGLIVDGAVIVVEATLHNLMLRKNKKTLNQQEMDEEVVSAASKILKQATFGEIIILIVYVPILTLVGVEGKMFIPMAQTVSFAIIGAIILSLTYIPAMSALLLPKEYNPKVTFSDRMMNFIYSIYRPVLEKALKIKYWVIGGAVSLFLISLFFFNRMGAEFIPQLQEGDYAFHCILPLGSSLEQSIETSMLASRIIKEFDEVKMVVSKTGTAEIPADPMPPEASDLDIILKPQSEWKSGRSFEQLGDDIMERLEVIPGIFFEKNQPIQMRFNELMTGIRQDVAVKIFGENLDSLAHYAELVEDIVQKVEGTTSAQIERIAGLPQISVDYDRVRLANYGLHINEVNDIVSTAFAGKKAGVVFENERRFDLVVRLDSNHRKGIEDVSNLIIPTPQGDQIPLSQIATVDFKLGPAQISRDDGKRRIVVGFNVTGRDVQSVVKDIQNELSSKIELPEGYYFTYGGQFQNLEEANARLMIAVPMALLLIFVMLYFTFNSLKHSLLIFTAIPMSAIGGVFSLMLRGMPFSISAGIGFIALFGVAVLNGIVLIGKFNELQKEWGKEGGPDKFTDAEEEEDYNYLTKKGYNLVEKIVMEGTRVRLRPVLTTATVASLGFLPMALSTSAGAEVQKPLATVVIGGLVTATILTLLVLPLLYLVFNNKNMKAGKLTALVAGIMFLGIPSGYAQQTLSVEEVVQTALENNQNLKIKDLDIRSSESLRKTAFDLPKTGLSYQHGNTDDFEINNGIMLSQNIPFPTLFKARKNLIQAEINEKVLDKKISENELIKQVRSYYYQLEYLKQNEAKLQELKEVYDDFIRVSEARFKAGESSNTEIKIAQNKQGEIVLILNKNNHLIENTYRSLKLLMGTETDFDILIRHPYEPLSPAMFNTGDLIKEHPLVLSQLEQINLAEHRQKVEKADGLPDFTVEYSNVSKIGVHSRNGIENFYGRGQRFSFVDIGIAIPITYRATQSKINALNIQKQMAVEAAEWQKRKLENELENVLNQYHLNLAEYNFLKNTALPNSEEIVRQTQVAYQSGRSSYLEYLTALESMTNQQLHLLETIEEINQTVVFISSLLNQ